MDVKVGNGAFMKRSRDAAALATSLVEVANGAGLKTTALLTDMNEPLASAAGNAVEVENAVDFLTGRARDKRLIESPWRWPPTCYTRPASPVQTSKACRAPTMRWTRAEQPKPSAAW